MKTIVALALIFTTMSATTNVATAQGAGDGPVKEQCASDIKKFCAGKEHDGAVRACLEAKKDQVTPACKQALDTTGGGQGRAK